MSHEKRFLLAIGLTVAFMYVWFQYMVPKPPVPAETPVATAQPTATNAPTAQAAPTSGKAAPVVAVKTPVLAPVQEKKIDGELWSAVLTNQPGSFSEVALNKYRETTSKTSAPVKVVPIGANTEAPLTWQFQIGDQAFVDQNLSYSLVSSTDASAVFQATPAAGISIKKTWEMDPKTYVSLLKVEVLNNGKQSVKFGAKTFITSMLGEKDHAKGSFFKQRTTPIRAASYMNDESHHWTIEQVMKGAKIPTGDISWAGFDSQYFLMAALPEQGRWETLSLESPAQDVMKIGLTYPTWDLEPSKPLTYSVKFYSGPKDISILQTVGQSLDRAIDLGDWLGLVARPMIRFLRFAHSLIPNYGIAIILLTVLVRLLLTPFTQMQAKSMRKMQEHKPHMDQLKEKYKDNKEAHSRELMNYMRTHKINPMGGCLLLLPQLPIFFSLYRVLYNSIELRHEPFMLWIKDLAAHDPYFVLPILLGIAMYFQQKLTPNPTADEAQQMMMKIMPVMFTMFMLFLPAGLCLYIFVSTLWGVIQQYKIQKGSEGSAQLIKKASESS